MTIPFKLDKGDRLGIAVVGLLGAALGILKASASDISLTAYSLTATLLMIVPGLAVGIPVARTVGSRAGVVACVISNGLAFAAGPYGNFRWEVFRRDEFQKPVSHQQAILTIVR